MAQQSIVLLKNQNNTLPLSKTIKKIALCLARMPIMPLLCLEITMERLRRIVTALQGIKDKLGSNTEVVYEKAIQFTNDTFLVLFRCEQPIFN
jgi:beta-glucosidase